MAKRKPTIDDLVNFTASYETFSSSPYDLKRSNGNDQTLAGYGSADPYIIGLARQGQLTQEVAREELKKTLQSTYNELDKRIPNFKNLSEGTKLALTDTAYNIGINKLIDKSPSLMKMINNGITDPEQLTVQMDHSKSAGGWLGVRSSARRAMALDKYEWDREEKDKFGRHIDKSKYQGPEDWLASPYYGMKNGGILKRR